MWITPSEERRAVCVIRYINSQVEEEKVGVCKQLMNFFTVCRESQSKRQRGGGEKRQKKCIFFSLETFLQRCQRPDELVYKLKEVLTKKKCYFHGLLPIKQQFWGNFYGSITHQITPNVALLITSNSSIACFIFTPKLDKICNLAPSDCVTTTIV